MRNVLAKVCKGDAEMVAAAIRTIFSQPTGPAVRAQVAEVAGLLAEKFPAVTDMLYQAGPDITAFADFPTAHWKKSGAHNDDPKPFIWTATAEVILTKVRRAESPSTR